MKTKIIQNPEKPHTVEIIADAIVQIAAAMRQINSSRLTRDALITLIARNSGVSRSNIECVLDNLGTLEKRWLKNPVISTPPASSDGKV